jgi:hypothetical protein
MVAFDIWKVCGGGLHFVAAEIGDKPVFMRFLTGSV